MKYKLKKDLPFAKAGSNVVVLASPTTRYKRIQVSDSLSAPMCELHEDQVPLWIEEVKPREWHISESNLEYFDKQYREDYYPEIKYIKVKEVL